MTANVFYEPWWLRPWSWVAGCFPAKPARNNRTPYGVEGAVRYIEQGYTLVMFPEGKLVRTETERVGVKPGIAKIVSLVAPVDLLLFRIEWHGKKVKRIAARRSENVSSVEPDELMDAIYKL